MSLMVMCTMEMRAGIGSRAVSIVMREAEASGRKRNAVSGGLKGSVSTYDICYIKISYVFYI